MSTRRPPNQLSRRDLLRGLGVGAATLPSCGFPPTLAEQCRSSAAEFQAIDPTAVRDPAAHARLAGVEHLVVVMMENRSFDHLLGALRTDSDYPARSKLDGLAGGEFNLDLDGRPVAINRLAGRGDGTLNPRHAWRYVREAWNNGLNDGFVRINAGPNQAEVMSHLVREQVPFQYALADHFTVCDRWFSSFMGQTWPNRFYLHATTSGGRRENRPLWLNAPPTIWERMALKCHDVKQYAAGPILWSTVAFPGLSLSGNTPYRRGGIEDFFADARAGHLPALSVIDPDFETSDGYPTHDIRVGEAFLASIYRALAESAQWPGVLLVVVYDENGGYFDHVPPPRTADARPEFGQLGFRVPAFVVGPTVWSGGVVSTQLEHASVAATLGTRFGIESLGIRMDAANDLSSCIDPAKVGRPVAAAPRLFPVELSSQDVTQALATPTSQSEMHDLLRSGAVPAQMVDGRSTNDRFRSWLRHAQELEAVKVRS